MSICSALLAALAVATVSAGSAAILPLGDSITLGCGSTGMPAGDNGCAAEAVGYRVPMMLALSQALTGTNSTVHTVGTLSNGPPSLAATGWLRHDGHPGFRIDQLDNTNGQSLYFDRWVAQRPDIITLHLGTNDCYQNYQPATLLTKMDTLLNHTFQALPCTHVFLASILATPDLGRCATDFNAMIPPLVRAHAARGHNITYVPVAELSGLCAPDASAERGLCASKNVHPIAAGYLRVASAFAFALLQSYDFGRIS